MLNYLSHILGFCFKEKDSTTTEKKILTLKTRKIWSWRNTDTPNYYVTHHSIP